MIFCWSILIFVWKFLIRRIPNPNSYIYCTNNWHYYHALICSCVGQLALDVRLVNLVVGNANDVVVTIKCHRLMLVLGMVNPNRFVDVVNFGTFQFLQIR